MRTGNVFSMMIGVACCGALFGCTSSPTTSSDRADMAVGSNGRDAAQPTIDMASPSGSTAHLVLTGSPYTTTTITSASCLSSPQTGDEYVSATVPSGFSDGTVLSGGELTLNIYGIDIQILTTTSELVFEKFGTYPTGKQGTLPATTLDGASTAAGQQVTLSGTWNCP